MHFGPLRFTPTIALSNMGLDTNVFNSTVDPKQDFTATLSPQAQFWLKLGQARLTGTADVDYVHYQAFATERALNTRDDVRLELPLNHVTPYVSDSFLDARERPGYEIDARARYLQNTVTVGSSLRVGGKSSADLALWSTKISFSADAIFLGTSLDEVLNRRSDGVRLSLRHNVTPLTKFVVDTEVERDRFQLSPVRNADSVRIMPGFDPFSVISGSVRVGFRKYDALGVGTQGYKGLVANGDIGYRFLSVMRLNVHLERDIAYSFDVANPYYLQTGVSGTLTRKVTTRWDVQATGSRYQLAYQQVATAGLGAGRTDDVHALGGGIGYTLRPGRRLGLNVDKSRRASDQQTREYNSLRIGTSISYGF